MTEGICAFSKRLFIFKTLFSKACLFLCVSFTKKILAFEIEFMVNQLNNFDN